MTTPQLHEDPILKIGTVARRLGVCKSTLVRWERRGQMPARREFAPGLRGWLESEIAAWVRSRPRVGQRSALH